jgi:hypothetical protein
VDVDKLAKHPLTRTVNGVPTFQLLRNKELLESFSGTPLHTEKKKKKKERKK